MDYDANVDAVCWFAKDILPRICEKIEGTVFVIAGSNPASRVRELESEVVTVTGSVPDMRPYINDVIGKIAVINQYLLGQGSSSQMQGIIKSYQSLPQMFEARQWQRSLDLIQNLKSQIEQLENQPVDKTIRYPAAFGELDRELQRAIREEAEPKPDAIFSWKAMLIDLGLKEKIAGHNLPSALTKVQAEFGEAIRLLERGNWQEAQNKFRKIDYPPELELEAKRRASEIAKLIALQESKS